MTALLAGCGAGPSLSSADLGTERHHEDPPPPSPAPLDMTAPPAPPDLAPPPPPMKKVLNFAWQGEEYYYYCGPSAARMALSSNQANPPSQTTIGNYMGTTSNGTNDIQNVNDALNHYLGIGSYVHMYLPNDPPSQAEQDALKQHLVASIDQGYALVANVVSGWRPPGYPTSGTIYHYITLVGYDQGGDLVMIADPAATGCGSGYCGDPSAGFGTLAQSYWIQTHDLGIWITPKGYTYVP
jgi:hypothetical protein